MPYSERQQTRPIKKNLPPSREVWQVWIGSNLIVLWMFVLEGHVLNRLITKSVGGIFVPYVSR